MGGASEARQPCFDSGAASMHRSQVVGLGAPGFFARERMSAATHTDGANARDRGGSRRSTSLHVQLDSIALDNVCVTVWRQWSASALGLPTTRSPVHVVHCSVSSSRRPQMPAPHYRSHRHLSVLLMDTAPAASNGLRARKERVRQPPLPPPVREHTVRELQRLLPIAL